MKKRYIQILCVVVTFMFSNVDVYFCTCRQLQLNSLSTNRLLTLPNRLVHLLCLPTMGLAMFHLHHPPLLVSVGIKVLPTALQGGLDRCLRLLNVQELFKHKLDTPPWQRVNIAPVHPLTKSISMNLKTNRTKTIHTSRDHPHLSSNINPPVLLAASLLGILPAANGVLQVEAREITTRPLTMFKEPSPRLKSRAILIRFILITISVTSKVASPSTPQGSTPVNPRLLRRLECATTTITADKPRVNYSL